MSNAEAIIECPPCTNYWRERGGVIAVAIAQRATEVDDVLAHYDRFIAGVHARHKAGLWILPSDRPTHDVNRTRRIAGRFAALLATVPIEDL